GVTHLPVASIRCASLGTVTFAPTATILPSRISTVPFSIGGPLTGYTLPPLMATVCALATPLASADTRQTVTQSHRFPTPICPRSAGWRRFPIIVCLRESVRFQARNPCATTTLDWRDHTPPRHRSTPDPLASTR